jgi:ABC-type phosphate transport system substrate-binding protein
LARRLLPVLLTLAVALAPPARCEEPAIAVIMAAGAAPGKLSREQLALIFKRKRRFWEDGSRISPLNLPASHPLRRAFTQQVFNRTPEELEDYWRDQYFHGVRPPFVLASEEAMIRLVAATPGAIGYVRACNVDRRVSVVLRLDGAACPH